MFLDLKWGSEVPPSEPSQHTLILVCSHIISLITEPSTHITRRNSWSTTPFSRWSRGYSTGGVRIPALTLHDAPIRKYDHAYNDKSWPYTLKDIRLSGKRTHKTFTEALTKRAETGGREWRGGGGCFTIGKVVGHWDLADAVR